MQAEFGPQLAGSQVWGFDVAGELCGGDCRPKRNDAPHLLRRLGTSTILACVWMYTYAA